MMIRVVLLSAAVLAWIPALPAPAADEARSVEVRPKVAKGERFTLQIAKTREQTGDAEPRRNISVTVYMLYDLEVLHADANGYVIRSVQREIHVPGFGSERELMAAAPDLAPLLRVSMGIPIEMELSPDFQLTALRNAEQVRKVVNEAVDLIVERQGKDARDKEQLRRFMRSVLASDPTMGFMTQNVLTYFGLMGVSVRSGEPVTTQMELPAPMLGGVMRGESTVALESVDDAAGVAVVTRTVEFDGKAMKALMLEAMKKYAEQTGRKAPRAEEVPEVSITDRLRGVIDLKTRWPRRMTYERKAGTAQNGRVDAFEIHRLPQGAGFTDSVPDAPAPASQPGAQ